MGFIHEILKSDGEQDLMTSAQHIAERSCMEVLRRLVGLSTDMSTAEARGYIRTRAAVVVHREVNVWIHHERVVRLSERPKLIELATELLVDHFLKVGVDPALQRHAA